MRKPKRTTRETTSEMPTSAGYPKRKSSSGLQVRAEHAALRRRAVAGLIAVVGLLAALANAASPAFAKRAFDSEISGLQQTNNLAFDASGDVWIADDAFPLHEYGP